MTRSYAVLLGALTALWGASYMFIKVAVDDFPPTTMVAIRLVIAAAVLLAFLLWQEGASDAFAELWSSRWDGLVLGIIGQAIPFTLIAWGEKHIDSGVAAIANASVPIFNLLLGLRLLPQERVTGTRLTGIVLGLAGVSVLTGIDPIGGWWAVAGTLAVVLASVAYAAAGIYGQRRVSARRGPVLATSSTVWGAIVFCPFAFVELPTHAPSLASVGSVVALGVGGTAIAQLIVFRVLRLHGAARLSLVTYLLPAAALVYGALILDEPITVAMLGGMALILLGVLLASGVARAPRREPVGAAP